MYILTTVVRLFAVTIVNYTDHTSDGLIKIYFYIYS